MISESEVRRKIKLIEKNTANKVTIEENNDIGVDALVDFGSWQDMTKLPKILHRSHIDKVHILHELIHLETFFIDQYSLIACKNPNLHEVISRFKNIPEDYVAHKVVKHAYGFNPVDKKWFKGRDDLGSSDEQIAANLINFHAFCEFCPEYKDELSSFTCRCRQQRANAYSMAETAIRALENMDYKRKDSYNECAEELIRIFAQDHYDEGRIYLSYLSKENSQWHWNP